MHPNITAVSSALPDIKILKYYSLLDYDYNMSLLYEDLKEFVSEKWPSGDIFFERGEFLLFNHTDSDSFIDRNVAGLTLYNLQVVLKELNIPNYFCAIISNLPNYQKYTRLVQHQLTTDDVDILPITSLALTAFDDTIFDKDININKIDFPFIVLSRNSRSHRTFFMSKLLSRNLKDSGLISYHNIYNSITKQLKEHSGISQATNTCTFIYPTPFTRNYNYLLLNQQRNKEIMTKFQSTVLPFKNFNEDVDIADVVSASSYQNSPLQKSLLYVALETTVTCNEIFLSKISFKGIVEKRPFVILGVPGTLKYLNTLGFKTFDKFWDESYDEIEDFESRVDAILDIIDSMSKKSSQDLRILMHNMQDIIEYNFDYFKNVFPKQQVDIICNQLTTRK